MTFFFSFFPPFAGPIWFGAEVRCSFRLMPSRLIFIFIFFMGWGTQCIAAGSHIANHEAESVELRPHASNLTKYMSQVREAIREQCFTDRLTYSEKVRFTRKSIL